MERKRTVLAVVRVLCALVLILGVTGCMFNHEQKMTKDMLHYLESKYREAFEAGHFDKGDALFPDLYGADKMLAYPVARPDVPFIVFKEPKGFSDNYIASYFSHQYTKQHGHEVASLDRRTMALSFAFNFSVRPRDPVLLNRTADEIAEDKTFAGDLNLYVALSAEEKLDDEQEAAFLYQLYSYMREHVDRPFIIAVGYVVQDRFPDAQHLLTLSPVLNFHWSMLSEDAVQHELYFGSDNAINGPSYFADKMK